MTLEEAIIAKTPINPRRDNPEEREQQSLFQFLQLNSSRFEDLDRPFAIPNGGWRSAKTAINLKKAGVKAGVWDIFCPTNEYLFVEKGKIGLFIEMKAGKGNLTQEQVEFADFNSAYPYKVCWSWVEAARAIIDFYELDESLMEGF